MNTTYSNEKAMFPLACGAPPASGRELETALLGALQTLFTLASDPADAVRAGGDFPTLDTLDVRLDGAKVRFVQPPPKPMPTGEAQPLCQAKTFSLIGEPVVYAGARFNLRVIGEGGRFSVDGEKSGESVLLIDGIQHATVQGSVSARELESALRIAAAEGARAHATLEDLKLNLRSIDDRTLAGNLRVKARKLFMSGVLELSGIARIDDELNLHLSQLTCTGEGVLSSVIAGFLRPKLAQQERKPIPLSAFSMGDIRLSAVRIKAGETIEFSATLGDS